VPEGAKYSFFVCDDTTSTGDERIILVDFQTQQNQQNILPFHLESIARQANRQMGRTLGQCWLKGMEASRGLYRPVVEI
jgi:hypothetical protein